MRGYIPILPGSVLDWVRSQQNEWLIFSDSVQWSEFLSMHWQSVGIATGKVLGLVRTYGNYAQRFSSWKSGCRKKIHGKPVNQDSFHLAEFPSTEHRLTDSMCVENQLHLFSCFDYRILKECARWSPDRPLSVWPPCLAVCSIYHDMHMHCTLLLWFVVHLVWIWQPSVLWCCWLGGRKGIRLVKDWVVGCWHAYLSGARCRLTYGPADATATHCLLLQ